VGRLETVLPLSGSARHDGYSHRRQASRPCVCRELATTFTWIGPTRGPMSCGGSSSLPFAQQRSDMEPVRGSRCNWWHEGQGGLTIRARRRDASGLHRVHRRARCPASLTIAVSLRWSPGCWGMRWHPCKRRGAPGLGSGRLQLSARSAMARPPLGTRQACRRCGISLRTLGRSGPVVTITGPMAHANQLPSQVDVPTPGCWSFHIASGSAGAQTSTINLDVLPPGTLPSNSTPSP
jgi:hypothetical protein